MPRPIPIIVLFFALSGCREQDAQNEARLFLERYDNVGRGDDDNRAERVERLRELPILDDEVRRVRDRCVEVQRSVIRAQTLMDEARTRVEALEDAGTATPEARQAIEALLARASAATTAVERGRNACLDGVSRLRAHHDRRR